MGGGRAAWLSLRCAFAILICATAAAIGVARAGGGDAALVPRLTRMANADPVGWVNLRPGQFFEFAEGPQREVDLIMMFAAGADAPVKAVKKLFSPAVRKARELRTGGHARAQNLFFVVVEFKESDVRDFPQIQQFGIEYAPYIVYAPRTQPLPPRGGQFAERLVFPLRAVSQSGTPPTEDTMSEWVARVTKLPLVASSMFSPHFFGLSAAPSLNEVFFKLQPILFLLFAVLLVCNFVFGWYRSKNLYFGILLALFAASTSGMFYTIINGAPFAVYRSGKWDLVQSGVRSMYAGEGWFASLSYVTTGLLLLLAVEGPPAAFIYRLQKLTSRSGGGGGGSGSGSVRRTKIPNFVSTAASGALSIAALFAAVAVAEIIEGLYHFKSSRPGD